MDQVTDVISKFVEKGPDELSMTINLILKNENLSSEGQKRLLEIIEKMCKFFVGTK